MTMIATVIQARVAAARRTHLLPLPLQAPPRRRRRLLLPPLLLPVQAHLLALARPLLLLEAVQEAAPRVR